jgi:hypothetical protein
LPFVLGQFASFDHQLDDARLLACYVRQEISSLYVEGEMIARVPWIKVSLAQRRNDAVSCARDVLAENTDSKMIPV